MGTVGRPHAGERLRRPLAALGNLDAGVEQSFGTGFARLAAIASQALLAREPEAADRGLDLRATLAPAPTAGDPRLVEHLIANLLDNVIQHNIPRGTVEITTGVRHQRAFLAVANSGPTIPPEEVPRLLQPFQRLRGNRINHTSGNGLGLAIVDVIAAAHHATLTAQAPPAGGLSVEVSFPSTSLDAKQIDTSN